MPVTLYGLANTGELSRGDLTHKFLLRRTDGNTLDLSTSFELSNVEIQEQRKVTIPVIPYRSTMPHGGSYGLPCSAAFDLVWHSMDKMAIEDAIVQIRRWFDDSPGQVVDIYWIDERELGDPSGDYYCYLAQCSLVKLAPHRSYGSRSGQSFLDLDVVSQSTKTTRLFPADVVDESTVLYGTDLHLAATNDGSAVVVVKRESDNQGLLVLTDEGDLLVLRDVKTNQDLGTY